jgi:hypothetical protein
LYTVSTEKRGKEVEAGRDRGKKLLEGFGG